MRSTSTNTGSAEVDVQQRLRRRELEHLRILVQPAEAALAQLEQPRLQQLLLRDVVGLLLLAAAFGFGLRRARGSGVQREEDLDARALTQREDRVGDFVHRVLLHFGAALHAVARAHAREQQAQVVVDLGGGGDGGARVARGILLPDGDGRGDAVDQVHVRLLDALQELPGVGGERLHVAALSLGVDGVEGERGLARPRHPRHHRHGVVGNVEVDVLEVMDAGAAYNNAFGGHLQGTATARGRRAVESFIISGEKRTCHRGKPLSC